MNENAYYSEAKELNIIEIKIDRRLKSLRGV